MVFATKDWIFLFHVFFDFAAVTHFAPIRFYKQTTLRTEAFTQSSFYAQILLHREVCAQRSFHTQMPLHTEAFTRSFYTEIFTYRCSAQRCFCTHKGTQALLHAEPFTQRSLCTEQLLYTQRNFYTEKLWPRETCTHRLHKEAFTHRNFYMQKLYPEKLSHTEFFSHRCLYAQKFLRTAVFTYRRFYTQMLLHRKTFTHRNLCTQHGFTHSQLLHREALLPPFSGLYQVTWVCMKMGYPIIQWSIITFPGETHMSYVFICYIYIFTHTWWRWYPTVSQCLLVWHAHFQS